MTKGFKSLYTNSAGKIKTDKEKSTEKIDEVIAMVSNEVWNVQVNRFMMIEGWLFFMGINY